MIETIRSRFNCPIGYSGHELAYPRRSRRCASALAWSNGTSRSIAPCGGQRSGSVGRAAGIARLVKYIRDIEVSMGDGIKTVYESELPAMQRLRRVDGLLARGEQTVN